jgi:curved DNA-binding protein CbpA
MQAEQYEVNWKNYYNILELNPSANAQEIKRAYRRLARKYHPDRAGDSPAPDRMAEINEAYEVLYHTDRRARYDERFKFTCGWQFIVQEALEAELKEVITRRARQRREGRRLERLLAPIRTNILTELFFTWMECLLVPVPLFFAWLVYLLMYCIILFLFLKAF